MRKGIALLITLFFVIAITVSIGIGLKYVNTTKKSVTDEQFMFQSSVIIEDLLTILKNSQQLKDINNADDFSIFLAESSSIPLNYNDIEVVLEINSARGKINPNVFKDKDRLGILKKHLISKMIVTEYADILFDNLNGIKQDSSYYTDIFNNYPTLQRNYIASNEHLDKLTQIYKNKYHDNNIKNLNIDKLFYVNDNNTTSIDLNFATTDVWELILGCTTIRAEELSYGAGSYKNIEELNLHNMEKQTLEKFEYSFYEPILSIKIKISQNTKTAYINFEYNLQTKQASNFVTSL